MEFSENTGWLIKALHFSADKHRYQRRKDRARSPYINHPIEVAHVLWEVGNVREISVILAALLHDTIEDTQTLPEEISGLFGDEVLALVLEVTDDKSLPRDERKRLQIELAPHKSPGAKLIKLADKTCNLHDLVASPPQVWSAGRRREYLKWTEQVVAGLRGTNPALEAHYDRELAKGKSLLGLE
jgi:guanosine-3',5'-bis(diphosphate) 3'-pyrophosphohydrolase